MSRTISIAFILIAALGCGRSTPEPRFETETISVNMPDSPESLTELHRAAESFIRQKRFDIAERLLKDSLAMADRMTPGDSKNSADALNNLAVMETARYRFGDADQFLAKAGEMFTRVYARPSSHRQRVEKPGLRCPNGERRREGRAVRAGSEGDGEPYKVARGMMTAHDELLHAVLDNPSDDASRLLLADYLDEHGDPLRAEFIRVQITMANCKTRSKKYKSLCVRERELWDAKGKDDWAISFNEAAPMFPSGRQEILHQDSFDRIPLFNSHLPSPLQSSEHSFFRPVLAWRRGFVYYYCDNLDDLRNKLQMLMAFHPITHAVPINRHPTAQSSPSNDGPYLTQIPPRPRSHLLVRDTQSTLPDDLRDTRLNFAIDSPVEAILALSTALVDEAKTKRDKIREAGRSGEQ